MSKATLMYVIWWVGMGAGLSGIGLLLGYYTYLVREAMRRERLRLRP